MKVNLLLFLITLFVFSQACESDNNGKKEYSAEEIEAQSKKANLFFDESFDNSVDRSPIYQSYLGIKKDQDKWDDISEARALENLDISKKELQYLIDSISPEALDKQTKISYQLFKQDLENSIADFKYRFHDYPVNQMTGIHSQVPNLLINIHQVSSVEDAEAYISRIRGVEQLFDQLIINIKTREEKGVVPPKFVFGPTIGLSKNMIQGAPFESGDESTLLADFSRKVNALDAENGVKQDLIGKAKDALISSFQPAYEKLIAFLSEQELRATTDDGVWKLPNGSEYYYNKLERTTTTNLTSDEIHEIGLKEVSRIHGEMEQIKDVVGFDGSLNEFFEFLKTDEQFYYPNTDEGKQAYLDSATVIINNMEARLDELFITKPKARIQVKRVEAFREKSAGKAFYQIPAPDGSRPGTYYANLDNTINMPKYEMESIAYHEGIPGHHMDRSISQELTGIPKFRKYGGYTAYGEGWGLYCEFIPKEMGLYSNPYADYGRLAAELWRACRLVVDTGIHGKRWAREEGIAYYQNNTSGSERDCVRMVERHIVMPGQATAYKIGMIKILELRESATTELGDKFDIREFHEVVLTNGAVPLNVLEDLVDEYIQSKKGAV